MILQKFVIADELWKNILASAKKRNTTTETVVNELLAGAFEFGLDDKNNLVLIDEVLTPDSSRFWPADQYQPGTSPVSFDKQFVRDYLETLDWNKTAPGPALPDDVIKKTAEKYREAMTRLTQS